MHSVDRSIPRAIEAALKHDQAGRLPQAAAIYRKILQIAPNHPDALHRLGVTARRVGKNEIAIELITKAINASPSSAMYCNLGAALRNQGKLVEAVESYRKALSMDPDFAEAHNNLGIALQQQGRLDAAVESYRNAILIKPDYDEPYSNLGNALKDQGKLDAAVESYRKALSITPDYAEAHTNLGNALKDQGKLDAAVESYHKALSIKPDFAEAHGNLGIVLQDQGKLEAAVESYHKAVSIKPDFAEAYGNLGIALQYQSKFDAAVESFRKALSIRPDYAEAHFNLGNVLKDQGKRDAAIASYRKVLSIKPDHAKAYHNLLFLYSYHALLDSREYLCVARGWEQACVPAQDRQAARDRDFARLPLAGRRLRVGYVSGDYCQHSVSYFVERLFAHHDRTRIELFAYSTHGVRDAVTERLKALVDHWVAFTAMSDTRARERIGADDIDVLIDLSGHTADNRLGIFACRAAPVQAHYLGYFASTGLTEMDYWIGDEILTPPETDSNFSEQVWRLPRVWVSYAGDNSAPEPKRRDTDDGAVWIGSFNNPGKLTPVTLVLWARILQALPEGRLLLKAKELADAGNRQRILDALVGHGIPSSRIELQDWSVTPDWLSHMAYYNRLDIALDPAGAVGGGSTTCDALWMGVPVITLPGDRMASRMSSAMLDAIGHPEWITRSEQEYLEKVVALARKPEQRRQIRLSLRNEMACSPLCDAKGLASALEDAYFAMFARSQNQRR